MNGEYMEKLELNKVYCMDCLKGLKLLPDNSVDLILTDPPYGISKDGIVNDDTLWAYDINYGRLLKEDGILIIFTSTKYLKDVINLINLPYKWQFIWYCSNNMIPGGIGFAKYTSALIFSNGKVFKNAQDLKCFPAGTKELRDVNHPTPKPLKIIRYLVDKFSDRNSIILDPFMGSGTTAVACKQLGRNFIGFEIIPEYVDICNKRLNQSNIKEWFE